MAVVNLSRGRGWSRLELTAPIRVDLETWLAAVGVVDESPVWPSSTLGVEGNRGEGSIPPGLPFVDAAVAIGVFLVARSRAVFVVFPARHFAVRPGRNFDLGEHTRTWHGRRCLALRA